MFIAIKTACMEINYCRVFHMVDDILLQADNSSQCNFKLTLEHMLQQSILDSKFQIRVWYNA